MRCILTAFSPSGPLWSTPFPAEEAKEHSTLSGSLYHLDNEKKKEESVDVMALDEKSGEIQLL